MLVVCPSKLMKTTLSSAYFGMIANDNNPSPEKSVAIDAKIVDSMKKTVLCYG
jgi:hypothetical protein